MVYTDKGIETRISKSYHIYGNIIRNIQHTEATSMSTDRWMNTENTVYTHNGILFSLKKEGILYKSCLYVKDIVANHEIFYFYIILLVML